MAGNHIDALLRRDMTHNARRLVLSRWVAGGAVLVMTLLVSGVFRLDLATGALYSLGVVILLYNVGVHLRMRQVMALEHDRWNVELRRLIMVQVVLDWAAILVFMHFTGGLGSPGLIFFVLHAVMVALLLPSQSPYLYATAAVVSVAIMGYLDWRGILVSRTVIPGMPCDMCQNWVYVVSEIGFFAVGLMSTMYLARSAITRMYDHERKLTALTLAARDINATLDIEDVLNNLARHTANALDIAGASIRLLGEDGERLTMIASHGLSRSYLGKGTVMVSRSPLDALVLKGEPVIIGDVASDTRLQYPQELANEGIRSMAVVPIRGRSRALGVLRGYSELPNRFDDEKLDLMQAMANQSAAAIENALTHEALQTAERSRAQFVRTVTHELRSPVAGSQSLLRVCRQGMAGEMTEKQQDILGRLELRLDRLLLLINDLLALAATQDTHIRSETPAPVDLNAVLEHVMPRMQDDASGKGLALHFHPAAEPLMVMAVEDDLVRVFDNVIGNAVKYTAAGEVTVVTAREHERAAVIVQDTGIGIPQEALDKIGEEFFRAPNARHSEISGTGLGMAIVRRLVERARGHLSIDSEEGRGTCVRVVLPLAAG